MLVEALVCNSYFRSEESYIAILALRQTILGGIQESVRCAYFLRLVLTLLALQLCIGRSWANTLANGAPVDFLLYRKVRHTVCLGS